MPSSSVRRTSRSFGATSLSRWVIRRYATLSLGKNTLSKSASIHPNRPDDWSKSPVYSGPKTVIFVHFVFVKGRMPVIDFRSPDPLIGEQLSHFAGRNIQVFRRGLKIINIGGSLRRFENG